MNDTKSYVSKTELITFPRDPGSTPVLYLLVNVSTTHPTPLYAPALSLPLPQIQ